MNRKDEFIIQCPSVGELNKILIAHDNKGMAAGWFLDRIIIEDVHLDVQYEFPCYKWLAKDEDDKQISRYLFPKQSTHPDEHLISNSLYKISVFTGNKKGAGTDASVFITLFGHLGQAGPIKLDNKKNNFEAGS